MHNVNINNVKSFVLKQLFNAILNRKHFGNGKAFNLVNKLHYMMLNNANCFTELCFS